jgi:hypothetical protein
LSCQIQFVAEEHRVRLHQVESCIFPAKLFGISLCSRLFYQSIVLLNEILHQSGLIPSLVGQLHGINLIEQTFGGGNIPSGNRFSCEVQFMGCQLPCLLGLYLLGLYLLGSYLLKRGGLLRNDGKGILYGRNGRTGRWGSLRKKNDTGKHNCED